MEILSADSRRATNSFRGSRRARPNEACKPYLIGVDVNFTARAEPAVSNDSGDEMGRVGVRVDLTVDEHQRRGAMFRLNDEISLFHFGHQSGEEEGGERFVTVTASCSSSRSMLV